VAAAAVAVRAHADIRWPHFPQRRSPERMKSEALPRRFACSPRSARIACALAKVSSSTSGSWQLLVVEAERDLPVALGQMPRQLEDVVGADAPSARRRRSRFTLNVCPSLSEFRVALDHAASRPFRRVCGNGTTLPIARPEALRITPTERPARRFAATSKSSSASSDTLPRRTAPLTAAPAAAAIAGSHFSGSSSPIVVGPAEEPRSNDLRARSGSVRTSR
jgi:hypothetical protein